MKNSHLLTLAVILLGLHTLIGAAFNLDSTMKVVHGRLLSRLIGRERARVVLLMLGLVIVMIGVMLNLSSIGG
ncbi:MAG: hypothetical protein JXJ20_14715 [Anaerolineae bacterium]|jgi:uncharacterized BrkB/YihY/UPF0761 family membrane protein|nr:hypothetical protein [Anaerolineae bacterium]